MMYKCLLNLQVSAKKRIFQTNASKALFITVFILRNTGQDDGIYRLGQVKLKKLSVKKLKVNS